MKILVINCGSSSIKYQLFDMFTQDVLSKGIVEKIEMKDSCIRINKKNEQDILLDLRIPDLNSGIDHILRILIDTDYGCLKNLNEIDAVGHRVGHGGTKFKTATLLDNSVLSEIEEYNELAPLHNPANLNGIRAIQTLLPGVKQVAVFDTAFHQTIPEVAYLYALPYSLYTKYKIRRFGFHGTSHYYVSKRACHLLNLDINTKKIITCHLGNGSSITAIDNGKSMDTSMGFTPLEGLIMGTRPGDMDIGIVPYFLNKETVDIDALNALLNKQSGLLGITGISSDMREIEEAAIEDSNDRAKLGLAMYCYRIKKYIGAYTAIMNGLDLLIFTGGIGENSSLIRKQVCTGLDFLGIEMDYDTNNNIPGKEKIISAKDSKVTVMVIPTNEEIVIAQETMHLIQERK